MPPSSNPVRIRVWDPAVRLFHWSAVALVGAAWFTAETGRMEWHARTGYALLALVLFRIAWGFLGSSYARFTSFVRGPSTVVAYTRQFFARRAPHHVGHNPLGGWMIMALLIVLLGQAGSGLFATDDIMFEGPLNRLVSSAAATRLTSLHHMLFNILLALVALHVLGVVAHLMIERENLVRPMITGLKQLPPGEAAEEGRFVGAPVAVGLFAVAAAVVWGVVKLP